MSENKHTRSFGVGLCLLSLLCVLLSLESIPFSLASAAIAQLGVVVGFLLVYVSYTYPRWLHVIYYWHMFATLLFILGTFVGALWLMIGSLLCMAFCSLVGLTFMAKITLGLLFKQKFH
jgi:hypothetical protein